MCLIYFLYEKHENYRLVIAANRDEYYERPTEALGYWDSTSYILAGRDLKSRGTWLGITRTGRFAAITNFRDPASIKQDAPSRGLLVSGFLVGRKSPKSYLEYIKSIGHKYNGFNLLAGDQTDLFYYSNQRDMIYKLKPGFYGLSNHLMNTRWPKVEKGKEKLTPIFKNKEIDIDDILHILEDKEYPPDDQLPDTGIGIVWERILSPIFVTSRTYGTRSSSVILVGRDGRISFTERTYTINSQCDIKHETRKFNLTMMAV
jgi:uncharacterized protein with NRDE domain